MAFHLALALALLGSLALALVLLRWAERLPGTRPLTAFLLGIATWIIGNELPTWLGATPAIERLGLCLLATAATNAAAFFHFATAFTAHPARRYVPAAYAIGLAATLLSTVLPSGHYIPFQGLPAVAVPNAAGWVTSIAWAALAGAGLLVLIQSWRRATGLPRRQIAAAIASSGWGLVCMSGYGIAAFQLPMPPWPLLGLPAYPVFLVYGILRYELLVANAWARRALGWALLVAAAGLIVAAVPLLPVGQGLTAQFATAALVGLAFLILGGPVRHLAARIIYPGGTITQADLLQWRACLDTAPDMPTLAAHAQALLGTHLRIPVQVTIGPTSTIGPLPTQNPLLWCHRTQGGWTSTLHSGWSAAPPGPRRAAETMGATLAEEATRLERAATLADAERARQTSARLAELGALAATVAHDVRNPLNIIGMAIATAPPDIRTEVRDQVRRIARLAEDLLDYAKPWHTDPLPIDLAPLLHRLATRHGATIDTPDPLPIHADALRLEQALDNLLTNARTAAPNVHLQAEQTPETLHLHICDDGPGVPEDLQSRIFEPFVSRAPGGTGLGLAIVARIAAAHGGQVALTPRPGWNTCLTLSIPQSP